MFDPPSGSTPEMLFLSCLGDTAMRAEMATAQALYDVGFPLLSAGGKI
jgi:hypothetical protein